MGTRSACPDCRKKLFTQAFTTCVCKNGGRSEQKSTGGYNYCSVCASTLGICDCCGKELPHKDNRSE